MTQEEFEKFIAHVETSTGRPVPEGLKSLTRALASGGMEINIESFDANVAKMAEKKAHAPRAATLEELKPLLFVESDNFNPGDTVKWRAGLSKPSALFPIDGRAVVTRVISNAEPFIDMRDDEFQLRNVVLGFVMPCTDAKCDGAHIFELAFDGRRLEVVKPTTH